VPDFSSEEEVYTYLKFKLAEKGIRVAGVKVGLGRLSPDIDLLLETGDEKVGIEVKYLSSKPLRPYEGIGEALALLLQSLDKAYLLHVFDSSIRDAERVAETAARLVRLTPLGYMVMMGRSEPTIRVEAKPNPLKKVDP
jgi:hypothetical protein